MANIEDKLDLIQETLDARGEIATQIVTEVREISGTVQLLYQDHEMTKKKVSNLDKDMSGNGKPGIKETLTALKTRVDGFAKGFWIVAAAVVGQVVVIIGALLY